MAGRKPNVFSKSILQNWSLSTIIERAVNFDAKIKEREVTTRDTLRADCLIKSLIGVSAEQFNSKSCIDNKLIDKLLNRDTKYTKLVEDQLLNLGGYKYSDINNMIYYLTWFACTSIEPEYVTIDDYIDHLNKN